VAALLAFSQPFGFVALLGVIALAGMIMRNTVILVDQIDHDLAEGRGAWDAIVESTVRRARPVVLTALAAILAMIPLSRSVFCPVATPAQPTQYHLSVESESRSIAPRGRAIRSRLSARHLKMHEWPWRLFRYHALVCTRGS
jgi:hypothetical protein